MKHCLLITAYKDVDSINRIIEYTPKEWGVYIHLDQKSHISPSQISDRANVYKVLKVKWGGVEHLKAFMYLLKQAYSDNKSYDYYHLITGQDFYSINPANFDKYLGKEECSYFEVHSCPRKGWWGGGYDIIKLRTLSSFCDIRNNKLGKIANYLFICFQRIFHLTRPLPNYSLYCGSVYGSLHKNAAQYILISPIAKDLLKRLKNSTCGEEIFFQTVLMNSNFADRIVHNNMRYIDWSVISPPKFLTVEDYEKIISSRTLFCRKIESKTATELLPLLITGIKSSVK